MRRGNPARAYERFLELPVPIVLAVMWVAGAVLEGSLVVALYWNWVEMVQYLVGEYL